MRPGVSSILVETLHRIGIAGEVDLRRGVGNGGNQPRPECAMMIESVAVPTAIPSDAQCESP